MLRSDARTSANTGVAPVCTMTLAVAGHVIGVVITSSPGPTPSASSDRCIAAVPEVTARACFAPTYSANRRSSSAAFGPVVSQPERSVSATAAISSSPIAGGWKPRKVSLGDLDGGAVLNNAKAYASRGAPTACHCLLAALADGQHSPGAIRSLAQRPGLVARLPVDAHPDDAVRLLGPLDPLDGADSPFGSDEKAHART